VDADAMAALYHARIDAGQGFAWLESSSLD
jgi:hypothetical protein